MPSTLPDPLPQILKSRPDWASGVAVTAGRKELMTHWLGAVIMNMLGLPVGWIALFGGRDLPVYLEVVLPLFTLLGLLVFFIAVRESLRWRRFGRLKMTLDPLPGFDRGARWGITRASDSSGRRRGLPSDADVYSGPAGEDERRIRPERVGGVGQGNAPGRGALGKRRPVPIYLRSSGGVAPLQGAFGRLPQMGHSGPSRPPRGRS